MKYTRNQLYSFMNNTNPENGVQVQLTDEPIRCDTWTEPDPVTGEPVQHQWCPIPDGAADNYSEFKYRMAWEYALRTYQNPNQTMLYYLMSAELRAAWDSASTLVKNEVKSRAWVHYSGMWDNVPNAVPAPAPETTRKKK